MTARDSGNEQSTDEYNQAEKCVGCHTRTQLAESDYCEQCKDDLVDTGWPWQ